MKVGGLDVVGIVFLWILWNFSEQLFTKNFPVTASDDANSLYW